MLREGGSRLNDRLLLLNVDGLSLRARKPYFLASVRLSDCQLSDGELSIRADLLLQSQPRAILCISSRTCTYIPIRAIPTCSRLEPLSSLLHHLHMKATNPHSNRQHLKSEERLHLALR